MVSDFCGPLLLLFSDDMSFSVFVILFRRRNTSQIWISPRKVSIYVDVMGSIFNFLAPSVSQYISGKMDMFKVNRRSELSLSLVRLTRIHALEFENEDYRAQVETMVSEAHQTIKCAAKERENDHRHFLACMRAKRWRELDAKFHWKPLSLMVCNVINVYIEPDKKFHSGFSLKSEI